MWKKQRPKSSKAGVEDLVVAVVDLEAAAGVEAVAVDEAAEVRTLVIYAW